MRVFISGIGAVAPNGIGVAPFWASTRDGRSGISAIDHFDTSGHRARIGGRVRDLDPTGFAHAEPTYLYDRVAILAKVAADEAMAMAGLQFKVDRLHGVGTILGIALSGMASLETCYREAFRRDVKAPADVFVASMPNTPAGLMAMEYGLGGMNLTINAACSSSLAAIGLAVRLVRTGAMDICLTGGADAPLTPVTLRNFEKLKVLNTRANEAPETASRPFSRDRRGFVLSEGAGMLVVESEASLRKRGAMPLGEILGHGSTNDARHILAPDPCGQAAAIRAAHADAGVDMTEVGYIQAHGTGTRLNDAVETSAIREVHGERSGEIPISSIKSMIGHTLGAAGALSLIATLCALREGFLPPTVNLDIPDPDCDLDHVAPMGRLATPRVAAVHGFGFGGCNNVLLISAA